MGTDSGVATGTVDGWNLVGLGGEVFSRDRVVLPGLAAAAHPATAAEVHEDVDQRNGNDDHGADDHGVLVGIDFFT